MVDFTAALNTSVDAVEKPKPRPVGSYTAVLVGMPSQKTVVVQGDEKPIISFSCKVISAGPDVDQDALAECGDLSSWPPFKRDIWIDSPEGQFALKQFLTNTLDLDAKGKSFAELLAESPGKQLTITLKHRPFMNRDGEADISTEIGATAKA